MLGPYLQTETSQGGHMDNTIAKQDETKLPMPQSPDDGMSMMIKAAEHMDADKLSRLMDLQERILNRNAKSEFAADYVRMKPHLPKVLRTKDNTQTKSKYAPLEEINKAVDP